MVTKYQENILESFDSENDFSSFPDPTSQEYINEPIIQKLLRQQEEMNRFQDISNPGISYGFYHNW
ncbi:MAG: hypothetical protein H8E42_09255 [Nitrospinae bacterium]|nr:hypothetical protein [Nitrospinota bacterium]MBL7020703.1 hypothetical protein [Nitrospinaceae bacterium]